MLQLCLHLGGTHSEVKTEHASLRWILYLKKSMSYLARWQLHFTEFDIKVVHRPGANRQVADPMSRLSRASLRKGVENEADFDYEISTHFFLGQVSDAENTSRRETSSVGRIQHCWTTWRAADRCTLPIRSQIYLNRPRLTIVDRKLIFSKARIDGALQIIVLERLRQAVYYFGNYLILTGQPGLRRMCYNLWKSFHWPQMPTDVYSYVQQCASCPRYRPPNNHQRRLQLSPLSGPLEFIAINILGSLPKPRRGMGLS